MKLLKYFLMLVLVTVLAGCSDDWGVKSDIEAGENFTGITLLIPDVDNAAQFGATRGDGYANTRAYDIAKEASFNSLYIAAIDKDNNVYTFLKTSSNGEINSGADKGYSRYRINLKEGNYRLYVVANLNRYTVGEGGESKTFADIATSEENIRELILNFSSSQPLEPGFLPMACLNEDIKVGENSTDAVKNAGKDAYVKIPAGENVYVYADLKYLCSKVRYTVLFDRSKSDFGNGDIIDVHRNVSADYPYATNLRKTTAVNNGEDGASIKNEFITEASGEKSSWPLFLDRYIYPEGYDFYASNKSDADVKEQLGKIADTPWTQAFGDWATDFKDKRAWQGVTYLPENLLTGEGERTELKFPYSFNGTTGANSPRTVKLFNDDDVLERAQQYDVYMLITTPDPEQWQIKVIPAEWTLQQLAYELHGPYELVVETSKVAKLSMEDEAVFWYRSDVPPEEIGFISPKIPVTDAATGLTSLKDLFVGGVVKNTDGSFATNANGDYLFHVRVNSDIPYDVIDKLNRLEVTGEDGNTFTKKDLSFFHIVAGSLQKRIEIGDLDLDPYLKVTPQTIIVDTRELYTSGKDTVNYYIKFETNVDPGENAVTLKMKDISHLVSTGQGDGVLKISNPKNYKATGDEYSLTDKTGYFILNISDIIAGNPFWDKNSEFSLTFTLHVSREGMEDLDIEKEVVIKVRPFAGNYVIHFRDNTKHWEDPHIYVYQDLTLPADMVNEDGTPYKYAGKIVGFIEKNPSSGLQWNAAVQYVFSNNLSFKGWYGNHKKNGEGNEYGGPEINNPWAEASWTNYGPLDNDNNNTNKSTMGFVMFGQPQGDGSWNYSYSYNFTEGLYNPDREQRYNYDVNFNGDHEAGFDRWHCGQCKGMAPDYNGGDNKRFYTGISMEQEEDGWWKYTLTGVAQPGRTIIIFANYHAPWTYPGGDYAAEDNRWPGDYESGVPLFDFEDNEGWFLFNGNTTEANQKFVDDKPVSKIIPHNFTTAYNGKLRIGVKSTSITSITVGGTQVSTRTVDNGTGITYFDATDYNPSGASINVVVNGKTYQLAPKNFKLSGGKYVTAQPLYTEFNDEIKLFVKWNDHVSGQGYNPGGGTDEINVYLGGEENNLQTVKTNAKEYGNYKYVIFNPRTPNNNKDLIYFGLKTDWNFRKKLYVQDLPKYYIPEEGYYLINVHKLENVW